MRTSSHSNPETLGEDDDFVLVREPQAGGPSLLRALADGPLRATNLARLEHEYALRDELDPSWAARPVTLTQYCGRPALALDDPGGDLLARWVGRPWDIGVFLRVAVGLAAALGHVHARGLIHKDVKPANVLFDARTGRAWLTGFTIASRAPREHRSVEPAPILAGTLAYMAPEQTGRMNRSIDGRSDLYALGVTLYEMLTGALPFSARDPLEWIHCQIAKQPTPPHERTRTVPAAISALVMKLLAKAAEERYQTAVGVEADLRRYLADWEARSTITPFPLGSHDASERLVVPEKLYGREAPIAALLAAFDRVAAEGDLEIVLVSGYSGVGKSSVVHELRKALPAARGLFASGKFDQYKRDVPYATFAHALQGVVRAILGRSEAELARWREAIQSALGPNGQLIVNLIPDLELVVGKQAPPVGLPPQEMKARFQAVFRKFLGVLATPEHPLVLFLDDLQWLDAATLDLFEHLATQRELRSLLLVAAYRDNEVSVDHPLVGALERVRAAGATVGEILLTSLGVEAITNLLADALVSSAPQVRPLAELVHDKTSGNPFFAVQFVTALVDGGLVAFDHASRAWRWDLLRIRAEDFTENVVDLMIDRLGRLPEITREALRILASLGNAAPASLLGAVHHGEDAAHAALANAVQAGLLSRSEDVYSFPHDRVQEASYALIPTADRPAIHLHIGRRLWSHTPPDKRDEILFDIVNQLDRGSSLVTAPEERAAIAELSLAAGKRAKAGTAYAAAMAYLENGARLVAGLDAEALAFAIAFQLAECELLTGRLREADERLESLAARADRAVDRAAVACLRLDLFTVMDRSDRGVETGLDYLAQVGVSWPLHPTKDDLRAEYDRLWDRLGDRSIEALAGLPAMTDEVVRATMDVLTKLQVPALFYDENLQGLVIGRMANLSLEYGNSDGAAFAYCWLAGFIGTHFGRYEEAVRFAHLSVRLAERPGLDRFKARVLCVFGYLVTPWMAPLRTGLAPLRRGHAAARAIGDLTFVVYTSNHLVTLGLALGAPLAEVHHEAEGGLAFAQEAHFGLVAGFFTGQIQLIRSLRGLPLDFGPHEDEARFEARIEADPRLAIAACWYWIRKLQARFFAGDLEGAIAAAARAEPVLWTSSSSFEIAEYHFYAALARSLGHDTSGPAEQRAHAAAVGEHHRWIATWAAHCPENFAHRAALVAAEIARIEGRALDAMPLYEQAIQKAREEGFVNHEALAHELAARFHGARGLPTVARAYLREARDGYLRWGALTKVGEIDRLLPARRLERTPHAPTTFLDAPVDQIDVASVVAASQALSSEIVLDKLHETLLCTTVQHAGAERGFLILLYGDAPRIEASAETEIDRVVVRLRRAPVSARELPESVIHHVVRTRENVIIDDALGAHAFAGEAYFARTRRRSIACLPLVKHTKLIGVLYLENNLTAGAFTRHRAQVLTLLASQAAISLENSRLYEELDERLRFWTLRSEISAGFAAVSPVLLDERVHLALRQMGEFFGVDGVTVFWFSGADAAATHIWSKAGRAPLPSTVTLDAFPESIARLRRGEDVAIHDVEALPKDSGERAVLLQMGVSGIVALPMVVGGVTTASINFTSASGAGDWSEDTLTQMRLLTEVIFHALARRRAELDLERSEAALHDARSELAHVTRVTTLGELAASIAHEINQPLAAIVADASACLNWLSNGNAEPEVMRESLVAIVRDGERAGQVLSRIRALLSRSPVESRPCEIPTVIEGVLPLVRSQLVRGGVQLETLLEPNIPRVHGDPVELQQVVLNLVLNAAEAVRDVEPERRRVLVRARFVPEDARVVVAVEDAGVGIGAKSPNRLFQTFFTTKSGGLGLGLSISRSIIERHGGRLWAEPNTRHGATFSFALAGIR